MQLISQISSQRLLWCLAMDKSCHYALKNTCSGIPRFIIRISLESFKMEESQQPFWKEVPEKNMDGSGGPWQFVDLLPPFDPPRHDSAETIRRALNLGVNVKMIIGDQLAIAK